jgi:hypothetical protein
MSVNSRAGQGDRHHVPRGRSSSGGRQSSPQRFPRCASPLSSLGGGGRGSSAVVMVGDGSMVVAQGRSGTSHDGGRGRQHPRPLGEAWRASSARAPMVQHMPFSLRGGSHSGGCGVVHVGGGWCSV